MSNGLITKTGQDFAEGQGFGNERIGLGRSEAAGGLDGSRLNQFLRANAVLFAGIMAVSIGIMVLYTLMVPRMYTSHASVMLDQRKRQLSADPHTAVQLDVVAPLPTADTSAVDTEVAVLNSPQMAYEVARKAHWVPDVDYSQLTPAQQQDVGGPLKQMMRHMNIQRNGLTYVIDIAFTAGDPQIARRIADLYAQSYIADQVKVRTSENAQAVAHLKTVITGLEAQVRQADADVAAYKARTGLNGNTAAGTLTEQEISTYNQNLAIARAQAAQDGQMLATTRRQLAQGVEHMGDLNAPMLQSLRSQQALASAQVAQLTGHEGPNHPELVAAKQQLADINNQIAAESHRYVAGLQAQAQASGGRAGQLAAKLAATQDQLRRADQNSVGLHDLQSKQLALQTQIDAYRLRLAQISTQVGTEQADARIVTPAQLPFEPSSPSWPINIIVGAFCGLVVFSAVVVYRTLFAVGVSSSGEVESLFGVEFLAALPRLRKADDIAVIREVVQNGRSPYSEAIRSLATTIFSRRGKRALVIAVTSPMAGEGKTTTAISLGRSLAMRGRKVLIVDCDLYRPSFDARFGIGSGSSGMSDILTGRQSYASAIVSDEETTAAFLPFGNAAAEELTLDHGAFKTLLEQLRAEYEIVLLDLPPVLQAAESRLMSAEADGTILLARFRHTSREAIEMAIATLQRSGAAIFGMALTEVPQNLEILQGGYSRTSRRSTGAKPQLSGGVA